MRRPFFFPMFSRFVCIPVVFFLSFFLLPGSVSLNAAMFMSVMLASRAPSNMHVALIMCSAVEVLQKYRCNGA